MSGGDYLGGAILLAAMLAGTLGGAWLLLRRRFAWLGGAEAVTAYGLLATLGILIVHLVPAGLGLLGRGSVLVAAALWLAVCALIPQADPTPDAPPAPVADEHERLSWPVALVAVGLVVLLFFAFARDQLIVAPTSVDFLSFHMPNVARWIQSGSIWQIDHFLPSVAPGYYPNNGDVMLLAVVMPWHNDFLAHFAIWPFYALTGVATYALSLRLGAVRSAAAIAGSLVLAIPAVAVTALPVTLVDSVMLFGFAGGLLFLLRHHESRRTADLVLAGLAFGVSFGTKWYGVSAVAIVVVVWAAARLLAGAGQRVVLRQGAAMSGLIALSGGIWLLRNWIESGNPVFPVKLAPFGVPIFDAPRDIVRERGGFTILDYADQPGIWSEFILPQYELSLAGPGALALVGGLVAAVLLVWRWGGRDGRGAAAAGVACGGLLLAVYSVTPYTAGGPEGAPVLVAADARYVVPALLVGAVLAAWASSRVRWGTVVFSVVGLCAVVHGISWSTRGELATASLTLLDWAAAIVIVAFLGACGWLLRRSANRSVSGGRRAGVLATAAGVTALGALIVGNEVQQSFNDSRYREADPVIDGVAERAPSQSRIGLSGVWPDDGLSPVLPAFGVRFANEVEYVGPVVRGMQQRHPDRASFLSALEGGDYDFLIVGRGRAGVPPPQEGEWAASADWERIATSDRLELYASPVS